MTEFAEMMRLQRHYNALESLKCDALILYNTKKKGFKPKYKWKDRAAHFEHQRKRKDVFKLVTDELCKPDVFSDMHGIYKTIPDSCVRVQGPPARGGALKGDPSQEVSGTTKPGKNKENNW